jgi:TetR/AcrR family transcriptional repressor of nem operon
MPGFPKADNTAMMFSIIESVRAVDFPPCRHRAQAMRDRIKAVARDLLIMNGYRGLRFEDIAGRPQITRANIHYHPGTKRKIADEIIDEYLKEAIRAIGAIWQSDLSYEEKAVATMEFNRGR